MPFRTGFGGEGSIRKKLPKGAKYVFTFHATCAMMYVVEIGVLPSDHRISI